MPHVDQLARDAIEDLGLVDDDLVMDPAPPTPEGAALPLYAA